MLFLVEKLKDLKAGIENDTYIDVILQSLPPSYDPFIVDYNMNGLEKSIHELINMLVQYEETTHKSKPAVLVGEASTSKAKGKGARCWKRKNGKGTAVTATASTGGAPAAPTGKGKGKVGGSQRSKANDVCMHYQGKGHWKRESTTPLQPRFIGYPKETVGYYFYDPAEKIFFSRNAVFLEKDFPSDSRRDEVLIEESSEEPHHDSTISFEPPVRTDGVPVLRRSTRETRVLERPVGCKWVYKHNFGAEGEVTAFKARLVAKGYTQRPVVEFEKAYSPVAMAKSIRILLAIAAWYDYKRHSFQSNDDDAKSQLDFVFKLNGGVVAWKSSKQDTTADSTTEAEYIAVLEAAKEAVWMENYIQELGVVPNITEPLVIFYDNNGAIAQAKEPRSHHRSKHILRCHHLLKEMVSRGDCRMDRVSSAENTADPLTKLMSQIAYTQYLDKMGLRSMGD
ncbi:UNVERIFIED_CONTAM: Retrovirus-related Pol polyprotein from transposon TNT 1-94 [Sesamum radiatum]|uniref:Retrovirus-related Pol polyprotein from transposon TNT 1-94 n=1 Tax=Sesamum radiatum TaxID=300843 RepID=A0AAW2LML6_SESRA